MKDSVTTKLITVLLALIIAVLLIGRPAPVIGAAQLSPNQRFTSSTFDVKLYESYVRSHHRPHIAYRDKRGNVTPFARSWMRRRHQCGGAMTAVDTNPATLSMIQEWQGCIAIRRSGDVTIHFQSAKWIS